VADRDPTPQAGHDQARDHLASTVDSLAEAANRGGCRRRQGGVGRFVKKPAGGVSWPALGAPSS